MLLPALSAGFCLCAFFSGVPRGVTVNGIEVGGMSRAEACAAVRREIERKLQEKSLTVYGSEKKYVFTYPELTYRDNMQTLLKSAERGGTYTAEISYALNGLNEIASAICLDESVEPAEAYAIFNESGEPFTYFEGHDGIRADERALKADICASLKNGFCDVHVRTKRVAQGISIGQLKKERVRLCSFSTYFDEGNSNRAHNIRLAAQSVNGTVLARGEGFSFNAAVGERTRERGYLDAGVIERGEFVEGTGGGVCQVSTTLFNAALLSGLTVTEYHPHTLAVGYIAPSRDAMVSGDAYDLKFVNDTEGTVYLRAEAKEGCLTFTVYGTDDGARYSFSSRIVGGLPAPEEESDDPSAVREGKDGVVSEGYLTVERKGVSTTSLYRRDKYRPVKRVVLRGQSAAEERLP